MRDMIIELGKFVCLHTGFRGCFDNTSEFMIGNGAIFIVAVIFVGFSSRRV